MSIVLLLVTVMSLTLMSGCEIKQGYDGKSAYELACEAGFSGTQEEWLASLQGQAGKDGLDGVQEQNTVIVDGASDALGTMRYAAAVGMRSAVSVICRSTAGAGVIYRLDKETGDAYILTNHHVVYDEQYGISPEIRICLYGREYADYAMDASYVGGSMYYDIALLRVEGGSYLKEAFAAAVTLADPYGTVVGQTALAIGNADAAGLSVTSGVVSVLSEYITMTGVDGSTAVQYRVMRVDTAVNPGNSGGGLFNGRGELIGIVNAKSTVKDTDNIGYAIPVSLAVAVAENILETCDGAQVTTVQRAYLGATVLAENHSVRYDGETGLLVLYEENTVQEVTADSASDGYLQAGDRILSVRVDDRDTLDVTQQYHLLDELLYARAGSTVELTIERNGVQQIQRIPIRPADVRSY